MNFLEKFLFGKNDSLVFWISAKRVFALAAVSLPSFMLGWLISAIVRNEKINYGVKGFIPINSSDELIVNVIDIWRGGMGSIVPAAILITVLFLLMFISTIAREMGWSYGGGMDNAPSLITNAISTFYSNGSAFYAGLLSGPSFTTSIAGIATYMGFMAFIFVSVFICEYIAAPHVKNDKQRPS